MQILLTGVAGFIANRVAEILLEGGHDVAGIDNVCDAYDTRLKTYRLGRIAGKDRYAFEHIDMTDHEGLNAFWERRGSFDAVINLAARAGVRQSVENPWVYVETNIIGTLNLLELCREHGTKKFVLASTSSLYGASTSLPFTEDDVTDRPLSPYAASKKGAEAFCWTYHHLYGLDVTIFRYFTVYGPAGRPDMSLFRFVQWISEGRPLRLYGDGQQSRDFTYVDDIARGTILGLQPLGFETINLGGDHPHSLLEVIHLIEDHMGQKAHIERLPMPPADVMATWASVQKASTLLGWHPLVPLDEGIHRLCSWYRENQDWAKNIDTED